MLKRGAGLAAALGMLVMIVAGCGGGESLSRADYASEANVICSRAGKKVVAGLTSQSEGGGGSEAKRYEALSESVLLPSLETEVSELRELGAPDGEEAKIDELLAAMQRGIDAAKARQIHSLGQFGQGFVRFDELAHEYGFDSCALGFA